MPSCIFCEKIQGITKIPKKMGFELEVYQIIMLAKHYAKKLLENLLFAWLT
jgi:hypothetical protein